VTKCATCSGIGFVLNAYDLDGPYLECECCSGTGYVAEAQA
jgi:excinuclease UvrABC ATPase subunit